MLELKNASKVYPNGKAIFRNLSCKFEVGKINLITGKNGSGKTSLLRVFAGLSSLSLGNLLFDQNRSKVSFLSTVDNTGYPFFTGAEYFELFLKVYGASKISVLEKLVAYKLEYPDLNAAFETQYQLCSAGMKQSVRLASTLGVESDVYLLDEPFRSLDPGAVEYFTRKILELSNKKLVIMTAHQDLETIKGHLCLS